MRSTIATCLLVLLVCSHGGLVQGYIHSKHHSLPKTDESSSLSRRIRTERIRTDETKSIADMKSLQSSISSNIEDFSGAVTWPVPTHISTPVPTTLSPLEAWCLSHLDEWYTKSQALKCPFMRRRFGDILDNVEQVMKYTVIRRESWPLMEPPQALRPAGCNKKQSRIKYRGLALEELKAYILHDWKAETGKGYYVTGKLTTAIYRDDCLFLGPDPDMPIRGLRKYVGVAAHLFDYHESSAALKSLAVIDDTVVAEWRLQGILHLPWRPRLPTFYGRTVYHIDAEGLIHRHEETWNMSVAHAFCHTLLPELAQHIWKEEVESESTL